MKKLIYTAVLGLSLMCGSCTDFLEDQLPQGTISDEQLKNPAYIDNLVISAYAVWITAEDINSSFSMWNYDVRSMTLTKAETVRKTVMYSTHWTSHKVS